MNKQSETPEEDQMEALQQSKLSIEKQDDDSKIINHIRQLLSIRKITNGIFQIRKLSANIIS